VRIYGWGFFSLSDIKVFHLNTPGDEVVEQPEKLVGEVIVGRRKENF
jgi:hypothetical protein